jgi:hypothetical protein
VQQVAGDPGGDGPVTRNLGCGVSSGFTSDATGMIRCTSTFTSAAAVCPVSRSTMVSAMI